MWLLNYQTAEGAFIETEHYLETPLHWPMKTLNNSDTAQHIALTAHVLITLERTVAILDVRQAHL